MTTPVAAPDIHVNVGEAAVLRERGVMASVGLGSCVAIVLHDRVARVGGMAHVLLPHEALSRTPGKPSRFATTAVGHLLTLMRDLARAAEPGATVDAAEARIVGGASMFAALLNGGGINMGERNVHATRRALAAAGIPLVAEDTGGDFGRSVYFDVATGELRVTSIRHGERLL
ncbi:MAG: chemotaxis protein CheD [Gemmatimonadaceae bacterium]|nr:chemotaxis protein CheD [Gemmatimonadaceae bacterium]